jgi:hypothetical protein
LTHFGESANSRRNGLGRPLELIALSKFEFQFGLDVGLHNELSRNPARAMGANMTHFPTAAPVNEWRVLVYGPAATIHGIYQFSETKAKEHAMAVAARTFTTGNKRSCRTSPS